MSGTMNCSVGGGCPRVFVTPGGQVIVQGYDAGSTGMATPPDGERQVSMDLATWRELARQVEAAQNDPFTTFTDSAWRLETLPQYLVDVEADRFAAFREGRPLPSLGADGLQWFAGIAGQVAEGKRWGRVHIVDRPLSDYTRFELECYADNVAAGEDVRIADRADHPELAELREDYWLFDAETPAAFALLMRYDAEGRWLGYWRTEDTAVIAECRRQRDLAIAASVPLATYSPAPAGGR